MEHNMPVISVIPFVLILLSIALIPIINNHWWEKNANKALVAFGLALPVGLYLLLVDYHYIIHTGHEYFAFIVLLGSLYVISGGIVLKGDIQATPLVNTAFLAIGAVLANLVGTTGASMLLIRPMLKTNSQRKFTKHIPIFFIFVVSNIGGSLTPLADPPLFLGYLRGVSFGWTLKLFPMWLLAVSLLLLVFYLFDLHAVRRESKSAIIADATQIQPLSLHGTFNFLFLIGIVVAILGSGIMEQKGINPSPWRELVMITMAFLSYFATPKTLHKDNRFSFGPIVEVAVLFAGIFVTMVPALVLLRNHGASLGIDKPWAFFWLTGGLSSFLDNAPTYLTFLNLAQSVTEGLQPAVSQMAMVPIQGGAVLEVFLQAISVGAVFMGAMSYIGNGPNFMVKSISEESGIKMPSFFGYMVYSTIILLPIFVVVTFLFFNPFNNLW